MQNAQIYYLILHLTYKRWCDHSEGEILAERCGVARVTRRERAKTALRDHRRERERKNIEKRVKKGGLRP